MSGIQELLSSSMGSDLIRGLASETGQAEDETAELLAMACLLYTSDAADEVSPV